MQEMSLTQTREVHDVMIGKAMRQAQEAKELAEEFARISDRLIEVEPTSPLAGRAQREVLDFCKEAVQLCRDAATRRQTVVDRLKAERP